MTKAWIQVPTADIRSNYYCVHPGKLLNQGVR
jgi:hypothetical protein